MANKFDLISHGYDLVGGTRLRVVLGTGWSWVLL